MPYYVQSSIKIQAYREMIIRSIAILFFIAVAASSFSQGNSEQFSYSVERGDPVSVQLFPIPAMDYINVNLGTMKSDEVKLSIHNIIGNEMSIEVENVDEHQIRIRVKDMAPGYYLLTVKSETTRFRGAYKFLKG